MVLYYCSKKIRSLRPQGVGNLTLRFFYRCHLNMMQISEGFYYNLLRKGGSKQW